MNLSKGGYYLNLHKYYNPWYDEKNSQPYTIKITGTLTYTTKITSTKKLSKKKLKLTWKKIGGVSGYEVYRSTSSKGTYRKVKTVSGTTYTDRNLKTKRNYYYKVRAFKKIGNMKCYTPFSKGKKARM